MRSELEALNRWIDEVAALTQPDQVQWCDGSEAEYRALVALMHERGDLVALNPQTHPDCYLHRSHPADVARVEHLTFVCTRERDDAGPNNPWMAPAEAHAKVDALFAGCMRAGRMEICAEQAMRDGQNGIGYRIIDINIWRADWDGHQATVRYANNPAVNLSGSRCQSGVKIRLHIVATKKVLTAVRRKIDVAVKAGVDAANADAVSPWAGPRK